MRRKNSCRLSCCVVLNSALNPVVESFRENADRLKPQSETRRPHQATPATHPNLGPRTALRPSTNVVQATAHKCAVAVYRSASSVDQSTTPNAYPIAITLHFQKRHKTERHQTCPARDGLPVRLAILDLRKTRATTTASQRLMVQFDGVERMRLT